MTCPHCAHFQETTFPELKKRYIDTGKVRYIFREFPLDSLAAAAFMLARCAGETDKTKYFALVDTLFRQQRTWAVEKPLAPLFAIAKQAGFTQQTFDACLSNQKMLDGIESIRQRAANQFKVESTPTFFINGTKVPGALSIEDMAKLIDPQAQGLIRVFRRRPGCRGSPRRHNSARRLTERSGKPPAAARNSVAQARAKIHSPGPCGKRTLIRGQVPGTDCSICSMQNPACQRALILLGA